MKLPRRQFLHLAAGAACTLRSVYGDAPEIGDRSTFFAHRYNGAFYMFSFCAHLPSAHFLQLGYGQLADFALLSRVHAFRAAVLIASPIAFTTSFMEPESIPPPETRASSLSLRSRAVWSSLEVWSVFLLLKIMIFLRSQPLPVRGHTCAPLSVRVVNTLTVGSGIGHFVMAITLADACDIFANTENRAS